MTAGRIAADVREGTADHDVAICFHGDGTNLIARFKTEIVNQSRKLVVGRIQKTGVKSAIAAETGQTNAARAIEIGKFTADQSLAIILNGQGVNRTVGPAPGIPSVIQ